MANASWLESAVAAAKTAAEGLGLLVEVTITRHGTEVSPVTGNPLPGATVTVQALIESADLREIGSRNTLETGKHVLTLYGDQAETGETITWDGEDHRVLEVRGIVKDADGSRYQIQVVTN